jgi:RND family efflux transporter MFP subunit
MNIKDEVRRLNFPRALGWSVSVLLGVAAVVVLIVRPWQGKANIGTANADPVVAVVAVERADLSREIAVSAEFRPYAEVDLHAKVSGYVRKINVDFGDRVKAGELLAVLEIPELHEELAHALATRQRAQANYRDTHLAYTRLLAVNRQHANLVAQQDVDTSEAKDATAAGELAAAEADVDKDQTLVDYTRIIAPFDGVITKRYAEPGSLIQAGTASQTQAMPLVRLSDNYRLRLDFPISVDYVQGIRIGDPLSVRVESLGGKTFTGRVARFTQVVDESTRTMTAEMELDNSALELVPGMYAAVILKTEQHPHALAIPIEAVPPGGKTVYVIDAQHQIAARTVTLGLETATKYEVLSGLQAGDLVMTGNPAQLRPGQRVKIRRAAPSAEP